MLGCDDTSFNDIFFIICVFNLILKKKKNPHTKIITLDNLNSHTYKLIQILSCHLWSMKIQFVNDLFTPIFMFQCSNISTE